jgi:L-lysine 2,3-aminomutase
MTENTGPNFVSDKTKIHPADVIRMLDRYQLTDDTRSIIRKENLLPAGLLSRLHSAYPDHSGIMVITDFLFRYKTHYSGLKGFGEIVDILQKNGIEIGHIKERELFIKVYRFLATKHVLNAINWNNFAEDSIFQLVFPQPGMINATTVEEYSKAETEQEKERIVEEYTKKTNPHDGKQKLNKPWFDNEQGELEIVEGSQHKYPQCQLIFDKTTQNCFAFCSYCFRHAQVRGDHDMFIQEEIGQVHEYMKLHTEITDLIITGGDAGYITADRFEKYITPIIEDPDLSHIKTVRLGSRALTFHPELILTSSYNRMLELFRKLNDNGIQLVWMAHFSTPREILNLSTIAAIRRLRAYGVVIKSQSPIMNHISLFMDETGKVDVDRSAQNWIDLGNILAMLSIGFHSMYCARPRGEHHYFTAPLAGINKVFSKVYRSLASINRPSRYISMTSSAGKISMLGTVEINGETVFALKFNEGRNMEWLDKVYLVQYDENENTIEKLKPYAAGKHFYEDELIEIENKLHDALEIRMSSNGQENGSLISEDNLIVR